MVLGAFFEHFPDFGFILLSNRIASRPFAANARCWALYAEFQNITSLQMMKKELVLETERLFIRKFRPEDSNDLFEYLSLPEIYQFEPGAPITIEQSRDLCFERANGNNFFAVEIKHQHKMIGHLYFEQTEPSEFMTWEIGYIFNPKYQGRGYCTEASRRLIEYGFHDLHAHRITAFCDPQNPASWHVLEKLGLKREGYFKEKAFFRRDEEDRPLWHDCYAYGMLEKDHRK